MPLSPIQVTLLNQFNRILWNSQGFLVTWCHCALYLLISFLLSIQLILTLNCPINFFLVVQHCKIFMNNCCLELTCKLLFFMGKTIKDIFLLFQKAIHDTDKKNCGSKNSVIKGFYVHVYEITPTLELMNSPVRLPVDLEVHRYIKCICFSCLVST
jgi:hypothetical protein